MEAEEVLYLGLAGSQAHGTAGDGSDVDLRGLCVQPLRGRLSLFSSFEQYEGALPESLRDAVDAPLRARGMTQAMATKVECVIYDVAKFLRLCARANPNALEILFVDPADQLRTTPRWERLYAERHRFLTQQIAETFGGYALAQLRRIRNHRRWLQDPPPRAPRRSDFGLSDRAPLGTKPQADGEEEGALAEEVEEALSAERRYRSAKKRWEAYLSWKRSRNKVRAALEREHGYDTKHAMHLVRLLRMATEALTDGTLRVRRSDAEELRAIRAGVYSYEALVALAEEEHGRMKVAETESVLPKQVDLAVIDALAFELMTE